MANIDETKIPVGSHETPIPGRLHDASEDHVVTGANEVFDDSFGERQSQVNEKLRHYTKMAHIRIDAEEITRQHEDDQLRNELNAKQLEIGAVETDSEPIPESPNMLPSGAVAFNLGWYHGNRNGEWLYVITDGANRIVAGIKSDGSVEWMVGVPRLVKEYVDTNVDTLIGRLEEMEERILAELETKVDKENGKGLIDKDYADGVGYVEDQEFVKVEIDSDGKIIESVKRDGTKFFGGAVENKAAVISSEVNSEFVEVCLSEDNKVLYGVRKDGEFVFGSGLPGVIRDALEKVVKYINDNYSDIQGMFRYESNPEYVFACLDSEDKVLYGVTRDGKFRAGDLEFDYSEEAKWLNEVYSIIEDPENRVEIELDSESRILSYRDKQGVKHESSVRIENSLELSGEAMTAFQQALKESGFNPGGSGDWSDYISNDGDSPLHLPVPRIAMLNISNDNGDATFPATKTQELEYFIQYYDFEGNYFKKNVIMAAQGNSSLQFKKKNAKVDMFDGERGGDVFAVKFGDWVSQDSYHLKAFYTDFAKGVSFVGYNIAEEVANTRGMWQNRTWKKGLLSQYTFDSTQEDSDQINDMSLQLDNGARCMPNGFPCIVYLNGEFYGVYTFAQKKHRDIYHQSKNTAEHIQLDGDLYSENLWGGTVNWSAFEVRNPKSLYCMDGSKYDGDNPAELIDSTSEFYDGNNKNHKRTAKVKKYILDLAGRISEINTLNATDSAASKALFDTYFDAENLIDYQCVQAAVHDTDSFGKNWQWTTWDGVKWFANDYDKDMSFGNHWTGMITTPPPTTGGWLNTNTDLPSGLVVRYYPNELKARWRELVAKGIFTADNIIGKLHEWMDRIGQDNYEKESEKWPTAPCNRDMGVDTAHWKRTNLRTGSTPTDYDPDREYAVGEKCHILYVSPYGNWIITFTCVEACQGKYPITVDYGANEYPRYLGYRDSFWRMAKYIEDNLSAMNDFVG